jgi:uncharacterized membrane protein (DUF373 family)
MHRMGRRHRTQEHYRRIPNPLRRTSLRALDSLDLTVYVVVGVAFVVAAVMALIYSGVSLFNQFSHLNLLSSNFGNEVLNFVSDLLLVLIIMEVLGTIRSYLEHGDTSVKPFIFIGIISATRGILSIGARLSIAGTTIGSTEFNNSMIELGINAVIIILLGSTLRIMGDTAQTDEQSEQTGDAERPSPSSDQQNAEPVPGVTVISAQAGNAGQGRDGG